MKLRHLLLASFAACTFASCSDDSSNGIEIPEENYQMIDANVSLTATALDGIQTKATTEVGSGNEQFIRSLTAYLFYADNDGDAANDKFAAMKTVEASGSEKLRTIEDIVVKVKAMAAGEATDVAGMRRLIHSSIPLKTYQPKDTEAWDAAYIHFKNCVR